MYAERTCGKRRITMEDYKKLESKIDSLSEELKKNTRRTEEIEKNQNIQHQDRDILEDILLKIDTSKKSLETLQIEVKLLKERVDKNGRNLQADIKESSERVEAQVNEVKEQISTN